MRQRHGVSRRGRVPLLYIYHIYRGGGEMRQRHGVSRRGRFPYSPVCVIDSLLGTEQRDPVIGTRCLVGEQDPVVSL